MRRALLLVSGGAATLAGAGLLALPSHAGTADACTPDVAGQLALISRAIVPVGTPALRAFEIQLPSDGAVTGVKLSATGGVKAAAVAVKGGYGLRLTAARAGAFEVQATWLQQSAGAPACSASGTVPLHAAAGTPLKITLPAVTRFPGVKTQQYDAPVFWKWRCTAESDAAPLVLTFRWEVDPRTLPAFSKGGHEPFRFTKRAKTFSLTSGDACDARQGFRVKHRLPHGAWLNLQLGGSATSGGGIFALLLRGGFRNPSGNKAPFHLGLTMQQGGRKLLDQKLCAWDQTAFVVAKGSGVSCWW